MKVILLRDVAKIGRKGEIVSVPDGYAQNQLIPKGQAKPATTENLKTALRTNENAQKAESEAETRFFALKAALNDQVITISGLKNDNGHLFAAIKPEMIVEAAKAAGHILTPFTIEIGEAIKTTGQHSIQLVLKNHRFPFNINVE
ncbi:50S ribosomal protein L9 [Candidatus Kaiserbacteria bacterium RIFCSPHIGHO2_01_FULL_46_22]|uniref:Large ribosomal subunit protein bL9 n=1 Tax=Candidatus Kaiserbacteria bacterium RIFCSPHIGHO2_01_FULL_46_22 TaxID=1798475 RepID=A0A1F6BYE3_9BACT|nr:MAG: 50S ribosomal protein L9 [Candidatus Kaiserbacteria bacterium RIFCSPHIGHO2_01_FULL_46_22]